MQALAGEKIPSGGHRGNFFPASLRERPDVIWEALGYITPLTGHASGNGFRRLEQKTAYRVTICLFHRVLGAVQGTFPQETTQLLSVLCK